MNIEHQQSNASNQLAQPSKRISDDELALPRNRRWDRAQEEIDALCHTLALNEFRAKRAEIWSDWEL